MSKKTIAALAVFAMLLTSVGILYNHSVVAVGGEPGSASNDEYLKLGDCNADGVVNSKDIIALKLYLQGESSINTLTSDVNQDGIINADDISAVSSIIASGKYVMIRNFPEVKEVGDGTLIYYEDFESRSLSSHSYDTVKMLNWNLLNTDKGAPNDSTALYSIKEYNSGKALYIENEPVNDSYIELLTDSQMGYFHEKNYTLQYDIEYTGAINHDRYISILLGYGGEEYISFALRNGGSCDNYFRLGSAFYRLDSGTNNGVSNALIGVVHDSSTQIFNNVALSVRYVMDWENGCRVYARTLDVSTSSGGNWVLISEFTLTANGASFYNALSTKAGVVIKIGGPQNGYIDNIMLWTGTNDEPADKSAPLLTSGHDECYNHAYIEPTCFNARECRRCDFTAGKVLTHSMTDGVCEHCGLTLAQIQEHKNFTNVTPASGASVQLANNDIYTWYNAFTPDSTVTQPYYRNADIYYPKPQTFSWSVEKPAQYYRFSLSKNQDMSNAKNYILSEPSITLDDLFVATTYYWCVDAVYAHKTLRSEVHTFNTLMSPRTVKIDGVSNTRDIGGYSTTFGYRVKQGMVYRGAQVEAATESGKKYMTDILGIKADLDLRGGNGTVSPIGADVKYIPLTGRLYGDLAGSTTRVDFAKEVKTFADPSNYPMYVHCALGRDRTGTLIYVINALLGVEEKTLLMDYELSLFSVYGCLDNATIGDLHTSINNGVRNYLNTFSGSTLAQRTENYLLSIGVTAAEIQSIRDILLDKPMSNTAAGYVSSETVSSEYAAAASENVGKDEIPYCDDIAGVTGYTYDTFNMMTADEAAANDVPAGYSNYVLGISKNSGEGIGVTIDPTHLNLHTWDLEKIVFRVWCPANTSEVRITADANNTWIMRYKPTAKEQWINIELSEGVNFNSGYRMSALGDGDGLLKPVNLVFRLSDSAETTAYVDSVTYVPREYTAKSEIPYGNEVSGVQSSGYDTFSMMTAEQAAANGVPAGYSNYVMSITRGNGSVGIMLDPSNLKIHYQEVEKILFRVWCPANTREVRITPDAASTWIMRYVPSVTEQWIDIELRDGLNFDGSSTMASLADTNGILKPVNFLFRFSNDNTTTAYIDSIKYVMKTPKSEIPYADIDTSVQLYKYDRFEMMGYTRATDGSVPSGFSGYVLGLTDNSGAHTGITVDATARNIHISNLESITFRVWCPVATKEIRVTPNAGSDWVMRCEPPVTGQWIDIVLKNGTNFQNGYSMSSLADNNGILKKFSVGFRFQDSNSGTKTTAYIDSIKLNVTNTDTTAPVISYTGNSSIHTTEGSDIGVDNITAFDAHENRNVELQHVWSDGALDSEGNLVKGNHTCTFIASDTSGNVSTMTLNIMVGNKDTEAPEFVNVPTEIYAVAGTRPLLYFVSVDNKDKVTTVYTWSDGALDSTGCLVPGDHTLTLTSVDATGNTAERVISLIVRDSAIVVETIIIDGNKD